MIFFFLNLKQKFNFVLFGSCGHFYVLPFVMCKKGVKVNKWHGLNPISCPALSSGFFLGEELRDILQNAFQIYGYNDQMQIFLSG